ncbi:hypothetical protein FS749_008402, partial [Ceratobasidium sp. UAMH 11750]
MPAYSLSHTRTHIAQAIPSRSISLLSIVESSPEPTTTSSGVVPGQALLDNYAPTTNAEATSEGDNSSRRYPQRARFSTGKISQYNEGCAKLKENRKNHKPRKKSLTSSLVSAVSEMSTTNDAADSGPSERSNAPGAVGGATSVPAARPGGGDGVDAAICQPRVQPAVVRRAPAGQVQGVHGEDGAASRMDHVEGRSKGACPPSGAPDPTSEPDRDAERLAADDWDFSADHKHLERQVFHLADADPDVTSQLSPADLEAILGELRKDRHISRPRQARDTQGPAQEAQGSQGRQVTQGPEVPRHPRQESSDSRRIPEEQAHPVQPPRLTTQATPVANLSIAVGGGHHLNQPRTSTRLNQSNHNFNTDTETETETEPEPEPERRIIKPATLKEILKSKANTQLSSPSPLPSAHRPIDSRINSNIDLPFGDYPRQTLGTTQDSTQRPQASHVTRRDGSQATQAPSTLANHPPRASSTYSQPSNQAGPSRPRGKSRQESSRAHRTSKKSSRAPEPTQTSINRLPHPMAQAVNLARARHRLQREREQREKARAAGENPTSAGSSAAPEPPRLPSPPELLEDDEEERVAAEAEALGLDPKRKRKPKPAARDVHGNERHVLTIVKAHLFAYSICEGPWQSRGLCASWVFPLWEITWGQEYPHLPIEPPSNQSVQCAVNALPTF